MTTRLRLLQGATALLYLGPLLAGLSGHGWAMVGAFLAIFVLWSVILRPHLWPSPAEALRSEALVALASLVTTQALLVILCFALGRGFGGVMGIRPDLPFWFPAALSFLSVPLSRLLWSGPSSETAPGFDPLTHRLATSEPESPALLLAALTRLPETVGEVELQAHLMASRADPQAIRDALAGQPGPVAARARLIHATDPDMAAFFAGSRYAASLFPPAAGDLALYASRALRVLEDDPGLAADFPEPGALLQAAALEPEAALPLQRLAGLIQNAALPAA
ncbi:hypothetical protein [Stagnihabitans tardus]|uniref:Uncharacterized protein n=1 Tax=Stagnihabitans tardus TaxID=2699202 RepID=A0AAE4YAI6_9RHOB|nr:hypothetical protein [Stagnihabitans tardus]NBZ88112.1 hypothetical protein [Stagnihabitans tardus]